MKNALKAAIGIALVSLSASSFAQVYDGYPDIPADGVGFASQVSSYDVGSGSVQAPQDDPTRALGEPDQATLSLGGGGNVVLSTGDLTLHTDGTDGTDAADFYVYEHKLLESWDTYVSKDNLTWEKIEPVSTQSNSIGNVDGYDLDSLGSDSDGYNYIKLVDTSFSSTTATSGADIDGVVLATAKYSGGGELVDTDSRNGTIYNLEKSKKTGAVDVKKISKDGSVDYIPFSTDDSLEPIALSVQGNFDCDDAKDINVLATRKSDDVPVNIIKDQKGNDIATIDNSITN
ncbi:cell envelope biogenesis protein OmpA [Scandinavium goeteborgense]|uniref:cell envelope biogenesis protein OmpA n=1 Tax=Scandinavium goeteborgense TaxID=1851514 RepID=UPI000F67AA04|nr:cell envelope biogenesis protein OmpA [Scandinavium goeteborgense]QKN80775.1 cell envelope biogenesis protein OmpA [Scandinavium goeteborgense]